MKIPLKIKTFTVLIFTLSLSCQLQAQAEFAPLWQGNFDNWVNEDAGEGNFTIVDGLLHVEGERGWLRSQQQYTNYILKSEFRWLSADADSGLFVRAVADEEFFFGWPGNSYQVQIRNPEGESRFPPVGGFFRHGTPAGNNELDSDALSEAYLGTGQWHTLEIEMVGTELTIKLNDIEIASADNIVNPEGYIGVQSELGTIEYRTIEIQELD